MEKATAIVLRVVTWSETSLVVTLFTREAGKVQALAKGARRPKGPFESALDLLSLCKVVFLRKASEALDILTEAKLVKRFRPRGRSLSPLYAGYYVAELLRELTDEYDPHPELFDAADTVLRELAEAAPSTDADDAGRHVLHFELTALRLLGFLPSLSACAECSQEVPSSGRAAFGLTSGGVLCPHCRPGKRQVVSLSQPAWETMKRLAEQQRGLVEVEPAAARELRAVMNQYVAHLLGKKPRMHNYIR